MNQRRRLCVVAGAGPGLGLAIAKRFAAEGHDVALLARDPASLQMAAASVGSLGVRAKGFVCDLSCAAEIASAFARIREEMGDPEVMVYNAARWNQSAAMGIAPEEFNADLSLGITGGLVCAQQVYPAMKAAGRGSLLFTGGGLALAPQSGAGVCSLVAAKAGLRGLVMALRAELAADGIRVGMVTVAGMIIRGSRFDPDVIADRFWSLHTDPQRSGEIIHDGT